MMKFFLSLFLTLLLVHPSYANVTFLGISDIHYGADNTPGDRHDTGKALLSSAMQQFQHLAKQANFLITLGDFPTHYVMSTSTKADYLKTVFHELYQADVKAKPIFYVTGNNDALGGNYQAFSWKGSSPLSSATDWQGACAHCDGLMIDQTELAVGGYYSSYVLPHNKQVLLIALNSIPWTKRPLWIAPYWHQDRDALKELHWLENQLKNHHAKQLIIAMHVPPGDNYVSKPYWHKAYLKQFIKLLNEYHGHYGEINLLTAHSHMDEVRQIKLADGKAIYAYSIPSISRIHHNNPGMKVFELNKNLRLKNYTTYYTTRDESWEPKRYSALQGKDAILPACHHPTLAQCLNQFDKAQVCQYIEAGKFYGVKSTRVDNTGCLLSFAVTS